MRLKNLVLPFIAGLIPHSLSAAITYVDAVHGASGNTYETGGSAGDTAWLNLTDSSDEDQDQWRLRTGASRGVGDTIFHARDNGSQDGGDTIPELTIELPGLADGTYNIYVFFWDDPNSVNNTQNIDAGLTSGNLTTYGADNPLINGEAATVAALASSYSYSGTDPSTATLFNTWNLHAAQVGQAVVSGGSTVLVYVDHSQPTTGLTSTAQVRTLFDGVGYELVPEPSTALLGVLGAFTLLIRRRPR
ncbi:hypothetical protein HAHE_06400 [Haloferula helveola]|uniref:PEP-CTERM protein-sorting domain-containing protein n=1 Tax=Haloferula helveola TaxID=490095 RepID=A0ABN6H2B5_9BACT|nr:hypothetical protein HAHE_06400 [Haloferula helveola]